MFVAVASLVSRIAAQPRDVEVRTSLDRTAIWVADRVTYTIRIACQKGVDILADDLSKDKLHAEGLEILDSRSDRTIGADDSARYTFSYDLTTYRVDVPDLKIAPLTVRYYIRRVGQRIGDAAAPAGEVQVPAAVIAFRSALPDAQDTYAVRDGRDARPRRLRYAWLQPVGIGLVLISIVPALVAAMAVARRIRTQVRAPSARRVRHDERASLDALQALDLSTPAGRRDAYSRLNSLVRDHLQYATGLDGAGLTPAEIAAAASQHPARVPIEVVTAVLDACDRARYAPADRLPSIDECRQAIERCAEVLSHS